MFIRATSSLSSFSLKCWGTHSFVKRVFPIVSVRSCSSENEFSRRNKEHFYVPIAYENFCKYLFVSNFIKSLKEVCASKKNQLVDEFDSSSFSDLKRSIDKLVVDSEKKAIKAEVDPASRGHFIVASTLYETYECLKPFAKDHNHLLIMIENALLQQGDTIIGALMKVPVLGKDPIQSLDRLVEFPLSLLGKGFEYHKRMDSEHSEMVIDIERCFFHDFFEEKQRNFLTKVACSWYHTWSKHVDVDKHQIRFSRVNCMCKGDKKCSFLLKRMEKLNDLEIASDIPLA